MIHIQGKRYARKEDATYENSGFLAPFLFDGSMIYQGANKPDLLLSLDIPKEYEQVVNKTSRLSKAMREAVVARFARDYREVEIDAVYLETARRRLLQQGVILSCDADGNREWQRVDDPSSVVEDALWLPVPYLESDAEAAAIARELGYDHLLAGNYGFEE